MQDIGDGIPKDFKKAKGLKPPKTYLENSGNDGMPHEEIGETQKLTEHCVKKPYKGF